MDTVAITDRNSTDDHHHDLSPVFCCVDDEKPLRRKNKKSTKTYITSSKNTSNKKGTPNGGGTTKRASSSTGWTDAAMAQCICPLYPPPPMEEVAVDLQDFAMRDDDLYEMLSDISFNDDEEEEYEYDDIEDNIANEDEIETEDEDNANDTDAIDQKNRARCHRGVHGKKKKKKMNGKISKKKPSSQTDRSKNKTMKGASAQEEKQPLLEDPVMLISTHRLNVDELRENVDYRSGLLIRRDSSKTLRGGRRNTSNRERRLSARRASLSIQMETAPETTTHNDIKVTRVSPNNRERRLPSREQRRGVRRALSLQMGLTALNETIGCDDDENDENRNEVTSNKLHNIQTARVSPKNKKERRPRPNPNRELRRALSLKMVTATGDLIDIKSPRGSPNKSERRRDAIRESSLLIAGDENRNDDVKAIGVVGNPFTQVAPGVPTAHDRRRKTLRRCLRAVDGLSSYLEDDQPASTRTTKSLTSKLHSSSETTVYSSSTEDEEELDQRGMVTVKSVSDANNSKSGDNGTKKKNKKWYSVVKKPLLRAIQGN